MAFDANNFDPGASSKGAPKIGRYRTTDTIATVAGANYFTGEFVSSQMADGDIIYVNASNGNRLYSIGVSGLTVTLPTSVSFV